MSKKGLFQKVPVSKQRIKAIAREPKVALETAKRNPKLAAQEFSRGNVFGHLFGVRTGHAKKQRSSKLLTRRGR